MHPIAFRSNNGLCKGVVSCDQTSMIRTVNNIPRGILDMKYYGISIDGTALNIKEITSCNEANGDLKYRIRCESEDGIYAGDFIIKISPDLVCSPGYNNQIGTYEWIPDGLGPTDEYDEIDTDGIMGFLNGIEVSNGTK